MTNRLILSCLLGAAAISLSAEERHATFTYACDEYRTWGRFKAETYDIAIHITDPALAGKKITAIRAVLNADEGVESTSVWLSKELTLEKVDGVKVTVPDTYSAAAEVEKISITGMDGTFGQLSSTLETPYELTEEGIYVGYTLTVPAAPEGGTLTEKQKMPAFVSPCYEPESFYIRASKDFMTWKSYNSSLHATPAIYVSLEGDFEEYQLGIESMTTTYAPIDEDFTVKATLTNTGTTPVTQIAYSYSIGGKDYEATYDPEKPLMPDFMRSTTVNIPIGAISELGEYTLDLRINSVNGGAPLPATPSASVKVSVLPFVPVHRPMLEEFTGTWCGWCTRGWFALETLNELYGDNVVLAAYHVNDPMAAPGQPASIHGCPSAVLNRGPVEDPYFGKGGNIFGMKDEVIASMESLATAAIDVTAEWADEARTKIAVKSESRFLGDETNTNYKVGYLLINNGITGTGPNWAQQNTYGDNASVYTGTDLEPLTLLSNPIMDMVFNDVVVDVTAMMGIPGSIPTEVVFNTPYINEFTIDITDNKVIQDKDKLRVLAFIINPDGTILNSNQTKVGGDTGVSLNLEDLSEVSAEYYTLSGMRVANPGRGIFVKVARMSDGSVKTFKTTVK